MGSDSPLVGRFNWADKYEPHVEVRMDLTAVRFLLDYLPSDDGTSKQLRHAERDLLAAAPRTTERTENDAR